MNVLELIEPWKSIRAKVRAYGSAMDIRIPVNQQTDLYTLWETVSNGLTRQLKDVIVCSSTLCVTTLSVVVRFRPRETRPAQTALMTDLGLTHIYPCPGEETDAGDADSLWNWLDCPSGVIDGKMSEKSVWGVSSTQLLTGFILQRIINKLFPANRCKRSLTYNWKDGKFEVGVDLSRPVPEEPGG